MANRKQRDIEAALVKMADQCRLTKGDFLDLVDCPLSRVAYEALLREKHIDL